MTPLDPMEAIKVTFFQECEEQLAELEQGLLAMEAEEADGETVNAVFRAVHSIKGGAGAFGLEDLVAFAHVFETALDEVRNGRLRPDPLTVLKPMLRAADVLADLVRAAQNGLAVDADRVRTSADELSAATGALMAAPAETLDDIDFGFAPPIGLFEEPAPAPKTVFEIRFKPRAELYANANEAGLLLRELATLGEVSARLDTAALPPLETMDPEGAYLAWDLVLASHASETVVRDVFEFVDGDCELDIRPRGAVEDESLPVPAGEGSQAPDLDIAALLQRLSGAAPGAGPEQADPHGDAPGPPETEGPDLSSPPPAEPPRSPDTPSDALPKPPPERPPERGEAPAAGTYSKDAQAPAAATIRVDLERVDRLIDLVGELVINQAMLSQRVLEAGVGGASSIGMGLDELEQLSREIQDSVMAIRAQPVKSVFQRMPRLAREVGALTGKQVRLVTEGEATEVDKTVIERLADPLTHMIRNAIDHGLETAEVRLAAGKSPEGVVRLTAGHRSGRIVIEVSDDGAGINRNKVREIAISRGLVAQDAALTDDETDNLIFLPGFSTATEVSNISGRGVGMDVVKRSIQALGGRISISSRPNKGSTFVMSLPLTLAVLDGMVVSVGEQTLVVPLTAIIETLQPNQSGVHAMGGDARVIAVRDTFVPLIDVGQVLGYNDAPTPAGDGVVLLIEGDGGSRAALLVDGIQGQRQVVIKSLEANYRHVPSIAAATILGDGRVALILDVDALVAVSRNGEAFAPDSLFDLVG